MNHFQQSYRPGSASLFAGHAREPNRQPIADHVCCPQCLGENVRYIGERRSEAGAIIKQYHCDDCDENFERTVSNV